jgi:hydroxymethylbilane synthase
MAKFRIGTRASLLALTQTRWVVSQLQLHFPGLSIEEVLITTEGDLTTTPLSESKTPGVFVSALRNALHDREVDFVVHSMKDLPAKLEPGIVVAAVPKREDVRDVLVSKGNLQLSELRSGARVGTSSPRRAATLRQLRPDLELVSIRGNVDTRIAKVREGAYDATILALAGLNRIGRAAEASEIFSPEVMIPAPGQGALAIELRTQDKELAAVLGAINNASDLLVTTAERAVLRGLGASCATPIGASARFEKGELILIAELAIESTGQAVRVSRSIMSDVHNLEQAEELGLSVAAEMLKSEIADQAALK